MRWRVLSAAAVAGVCLSTAAPLAVALPAPVSPSDPSVAEQWVNPAARADESSLVGLRIVDAPDLGAAQLAPDQPLRVTLSVFNNSDEEVTDLSIVARRADASPSVGEARRILSLSREAYPYFGPDLDLSDPLAAGERREVSFTVPAKELSLTPGATYPVMFSLSGTTGEGPQQLGTERLLVTVGEAPPADDADTPPEQIPGLSLIYPLTAEVDIVPGETGTAPEEPPLILASDQLAGQLSPGGRLSELLEDWRTTTDEVRSSSCLALDPALVDTVARMAEGYTVSDTRPALVTEPQRLRDSWFTEQGTEVGQPGRGAADADRWLSDLAETAATGCTVALPWGNADLNAVAATGDEWLFREAVQRGPATLQSVLGVVPEGNIVVPGPGYVTEQAAPRLAWADQSSSDILTTGMQQAWEESVARLTPRDPGGDDDSALESTDVPTPSPAGPPAPGEPVRVLVADNTVWSAPQAGPFASLAPGITAVTYPGALGAVLAATGPAPVTTGYSNPDSRIDYRADSTTARAVTAGAALRLAVDRQTLPGDWAESPEPVLAVPPTHLDPETGAVLLDTAAELLADDRARPVPLTEAVTPSPTQQADLDAQQPVPPTPGSARFGSPYPDPAVVTDAETLRAGQQARYIDDLTRMAVNDPAISLSRYGFTLPLRRDVLTSLTATSRSSLGTHEDAVERTDARLDGNRRTLQELRGSVALIPPGNVYTRVSESSPLLIVAENGLPLPVEAELAYSGPDGARISVPERVHIPAHGSITVQMTADLPTARDQTQLTLWLATLDGSPISTPVDITVQTRAGIVGTYGIGLLLVVGLSLALLFRVGRRRKQQRQHRQHRRRRG